MTSYPTKLPRDLAPVLALLPQMTAESRRRLIGLSCLTDALALCLRLSAWDEAIGLYAAALPRREAVWWASLCCGLTAPQDQTLAALRAREAAECWVRRQDEESRRAAQAAAGAAEPAPEAWVAMAAFWSGGSIAPLGLSEVPPAPHLTATAVQGALGLAAIRPDPAQRVRWQTDFLSRADDIARGGDGRTNRGAP
ncbi:MAG: hypothetical protein RLZZ501_1167 [Pseudomonadota bacterium]|jgi:hypothetical protein